MTQTPIKIAIVAAEHSGDLLGAGLIRELRQLIPHLEVVGVAGPEMLKAGCNALASIEELSVMGFIEPLKQLPRILKLRKKLLHQFSENPPAVFIGIDAPDFNLSLEKQLKQHGIPTVHYVSPSVWAWRQGRIHKIKKAVDLLLTLFPFETNFYKEHNVLVKYVGHPLADRIPFEVDRNKARTALHLSPDARIIALMPGSRAMELRYLGECFIKTAQACLKQDVSLQFVTSMVNSKRRKQFEEILKKTAPDLPIEIFEGQSQTIMTAANVLLLTSGTITLEAMLLKRPMIVAYRMRPLIYKLMKRIVKIPYFSLPNLIAKKRLVPEFLQEEATPENLSKELLNLINDPAKQASLMEHFHELHRQLRNNADKKAATAIQSLLLKTGA